jgi:hypothetical protein
MAPNETSFLPAFSFATPLHPFNVNEVHGDLALNQLAHHFMFSSTTKTRASAVPDLVCP